MHHNYYEYLKSSRYLRIFCTLPMSYNKKITPRPRFQPFPILWFYGTALFFLFSIMLFAATYTIMEHRQNDKPTKITVKLVKIAVTLTILLIIFRKQEKFTHCMNLILYYEEQMEALNIKFTYRSLRLLLLIKKIMVLGTSIMGNLSCFLTDGHTHTYCLVSFITYNVTFLIASIVLTQFCGLILTVRQHLIIVNRSLIKLVSLRKNHTEDAQKLRDFMGYHHNMCDLSKKINEAFSGQLLLIIMRSFLEILNSMYSLVKQESHYLVVYDLFWSVCALFEFIFMLFACRRTSETSLRTGYILNLLHANNDERLNFVRNTFLLQIKHKHIRFTASHLFAIDNKMFLNLISGTLAYFLIIMQFETSKN